jgi:HK97 family phage portal protein
MNTPWYNEQSVSQKHSVVLTEWNRKRQEEKTITTTGDLYKELLGRSGVKSGVVVNHKTAFEVSVVYRCAALLAEGLAMVPFKVHQAKGETIEPAFEHDLYWLLSKKPNDFQTSFEFREQIALHLALCQEAFVFKNIVRNRVVELLPYPPQSVTKVVNSDMSLSYKITLKNGRVIDVAARNMWHIKGKTWDGVDPIETVKMAREAIGLALATEEHSARMFSNGARVGGVLSTDSNLNKEQLELIKTNWDATQGGSMNAFKTAILFGGLKWEPMGFDNNDSQMIESRRNQVEEICRYFGVLPIMVGFADKTATYASAEAQFTAHVMYTLLPMYRRIEDSADVHLLGMDDVKKGIYTKFNAAGLLRGSIKDRGDFYTKLYNVGAINPNEIRALEEMNPYEGGEKYRVPLNMTDPNNDSGQNDGNKPNDEGDKA